MLISVQCCFVRVLAHVGERDVCRVFGSGSNGPQKFCIEKVGKENWLPRSHTWYIRSLHTHLILILRLLVRGGMFKTLVQWLQHIFNVMY